MARNNDPLIESLMQMAVAAAPLIRKARESGIFRDRDDDIMDAEVVAGGTAGAAKPPEPAKEAAPADVQAMQDIIVRQALRINELEAEVTKLKAAKAKPAKAGKTRPKPAA